MCQVSYFSLGAKELKGPWHLMFDYNMCYMGESLDVHKHAGETPVHLVEQLIYNEYYYKHVSHLKVRQHLCTREP